MPPRVSVMSVGCPESGFMGPTVGIMGADELMHAQVKTESTGG